MRRYKGKCDIFFGIEHRPKKEEMEEHFNREAEEGWRFAADAARLTDTRREESLLQSTATWEQLWEQKKGGIDSTPGNEGRIAQAWVHVRGGLRIFSVYFWHSKGWTPRNEALLEAVARQATVTRHPFVVSV